MCCNIIILLIVLLDILFPLSFPFPSFSSLLSRSFLFLCSLRVLYNVFLSYSTPLQLLSNSVPLLYPPNFMFLKKSPSRPNCVALIFSNVWSASRSYKTIWTVTVLKKTVSPSPGIFRLYAQLPFPQWDSFWHGLAQVLYMLSQLLWAHVYSCPAGSRKQCFLAVIHCLWLLH